MNTDPVLVALADIFVEDPGQPDAQALTLRTAGSWENPHVSRVRACMVFDWMVRVYLPCSLECHAEGDFKDHAKLLRALSPIADEKSLKVALDMVRAGHDAASALHGVAMAACPHPAPAVAVAGETMRRTGWDAARAATDAVAWRPDARAAMAECSEVLKLARQARTTRVERQRRMQRDSAVAAALAADDGLRRAAERQRAMGLTWGMSRGMLEAAAARAVRKYGATDGWSAQCAAKTALWGFQARLRPSAEELFDAMVAASGEPSARNADDAAVRAVS